MVAAGVLLSSSAGAEATCVNEAFRTGLSADLPDCRAYELVTPESTGQILRWLPDRVATGDLFPTEPASPDGFSLIFSTKAAPLPDLPGANGMDGGREGFEAQRMSTGWQVLRHVTPSGAESVDPEAGGASSDHRYIFIHAGPRQKPEAAAYNGSLYLGSDADYLGGPEGSFELVGLGALGSEKFAEGRYISPGGDHVIFTTGKDTTESVWCNNALKFGVCPVKQLEPNAPPNGTGAVYDRAADGPTRVVSLLPGNVTPAAGQDAFYQGVSRDGTVVAFKINGTLYVRVDNAGTEKVTEAESEFGGLSSDGRYLFYVSAGNIHRFDTESKVDEEVNSSGDGRMVNVSADGSHVYFISESQLDGANGSANQPNLYVWSGGSPRYVVTLGSSDVLPLVNWTTVVGPNYGNGGSRPGANLSRTTPDGSVFIFASRAQLTAYDNAGQSEIYRYEDQGQPPECVSCDPEGSAAVSGARLQHPKAVVSVIHNLSDDGTRVFFETTEALVKSDEDGVNDIYEWHQSPAGGVSELDLISSGQSVGYAEVEGFNEANILMGITPDGSNVFFRSTDALAAGAGLGGVQAIYDARIVGGFPLTATPSVCSEEGCRPSLASTPLLGSPASSVLRGAGNVKPKKKHKKQKGRRCNRGSKKRKHCAKAHAHKKTGKAARAKSSKSSESTLTETVAPSASTSASSSSTSELPAAAGLRAAPASAASEGFEEYGIRSAAATVSTNAAGMHPDLMTNIEWIPPHSGFSPQTENVVVSLPPGLYGNPNLTPRCSTGEFISLECSPDSQIGLSKLKARNLVGNAEGFVLAPIYNLLPPHPEKEIARLGLAAPLFPIFLDVSVRTAGDYGVIGSIHGAPATFPVEVAKTTVWGNPAASSHDEERMTMKEALNCNSPCEAPEGKRKSNLGPIAFLTNSSACQSQEVGVGVTSYELPGQVFDKSAPLPSITDCTGLPFAPTFEAEPTSHAAGAPTGLKTKLLLPQASSEAVDSPSTATIREARVTLPAGMQVAAGAANWIGTCSEEQVGFHEEVDAACPDNSKLGTATIVSPALSEPLEGTVYQRSPRPGHQLGLWLTTDALGLHVKIPGDLEPDPNTGRLTAVFRDLPQVPVEEIDLNVWGGPRAPLQNPDRCGTFTTDFTFAPHSEDPAVSGQSTMQITEGCNQGFDPKLNAGVTNPVAGKFSPLIVDLTREDGQQQMRGFELELPDGELAKLKGVPLCPDAAASSGNCPADSAIGPVVAATGPGPEPLWVPQPGKAEPKVYLAGPYKGSPFSVVTEVPAQAGPFDLGTLVVRSGLGLDPDTNRPVVKADPLPQFFEGVGLTYRRLHIVVDRPGFSLNPTDCREMQVDSTINSIQGTVAHPAARFQVDGCKRLKFKPKLSLKLKGGTGRGDYPALTAVLKARKGDANIARTSVNLPHSEFLAQEHIVTICTRVQFAADKCPKGSVYGRAKAWTPLLAKPLEGPVYLRSSSHPLPDMVVALGGELDVNLVGRIDSHNGGIRSSFEAVPDAPVTRFVLRMRGGKKSLLVNSTDICRGKHRAQVVMGAQNGRRVSSKPALGVRCG